MSHVAVVGAGKRYEGVRALRDVTLSVQRGTIHAFVGENGAGKSTLGKVIAGAVRLDDGQLLVDGVPTRFGSPREALDGGIALVHQEVALAPGLSVLDNVFLGDESTVGGVLRHKRQRRRFAELMDETGFGLDPDLRTRQLRVSDQQKVEITRALARDAQLVVLDEPTAALTVEESSRLAELVRRLRARGTTIIWVSHYLEEVLDLADTVSVLKDGRHVSTSPCADESVDSLVTKMLGRSLDAMFPAKEPGRVSERPVLRVRGLSRAPVVRDVSFDVRAGEIVGLAGLVGSGRTEVARAIFGADAADSGTIEVDGRRVRVRSPRAAVAKGIAMLPEDRKDQGLVMTGTIRENLTLTCLPRVARGGWLRRRAERDVALEIAERVDIRMRSIDAPVSLLSGGNQQKVVLGKWLLRSPAVLIADEPTRGVDVGARFTIYELLCGMAAQGLGVLLISSDLEEVMGLADRILVMHRGSVVADLPGDADEERILSAAFGRGLGGLGDPADAA